MKGIRHSRLRSEHQRLTWEVEELRARLARETRGLRSQLTSLQNAVTDDDGRVLGKLRDLLEELQLSEAINQVDWIELEVRRPSELKRLQEQFSEHFPERSLLDRPRGEAVDEEA